VRYFLLVKLILANLMLTAQSDTLVYYFHKNLNSCPKEFASFVGYGIKENGMIRYTNYRIETRAMITAGYYTDSTLAVKDGFFQQFSQAGEKESEGLYRNNLKEGWWAHWRSWDLKNVSDSIFFEAGKDITTIGINYHSNGHPSSRILHNNRDEIKEFTQWYLEGLLRSKAVWIGGTGDQIEYYPGGEIKSVVSYKKSKISNTKYYRQDGTVISKNEMQKAEASLIEQLEKLIPSFPGGHDGFRTYLNSHFQIPFHLRELVKTMHTITLVFYLNEKGIANNISVLESSNADLQQAMVNFFRNLPRWDMKGHKEYGPLRYTVRLL